MRHHRRRLLLEIVGRQEIVFPGDEHFEERQVRRASARRVATSSSDTFRRSSVSSVWLIHHAKAGAAIQINPNIEAIAAFNRIDGEDKTDARTPDGGRRPHQR